MMPRMPSRVLLFAFLLPFCLAYSRRPKSGVIKPPQCGESIGCFSNCKGTECGFVATFVAKSATETNFTFEVNVGSVSSIYAAIGFSTDDEMGDDSVMECVVYGGTRKIYQSWNEEDETERLSNADNQEALIGAQTITLENGILKCTFTRQNTPTDNKDGQIFDINKDWILQFAVGPVEKDDEIEYHEYEPWISDGAAVDLQSTVDVKPKPLGSSLIRAHGCIMVIAWMICSSLGMLMARYYKKLWTNRKIFGMAVWFQVHRVLMVFTTFLTVLSFIIILAYAEGKLETQGDGLVSAHPILGLIVFILALANPLGALFRPNPTHKMRPVFNFLHMAAAIVAQLLSVLTLCGGVLYEKSEMDPKSLFVVIGYALWHMAVEVVLILVTFFARRKDLMGYHHKRMDNTTDFNLSTNSASKPPAADGAELWAAKPKKIILVIHIVVAFVFTLALMILVIQGGH